jgi:hypothetical protein
MASGISAERCESGLIGTPGKRVCRQRYRGFESRPLRHTGVSSNQVMSRLPTYSRYETSAAAWSVALVPAGSCLVDAVALADFRWT